MVLEDFTTYTKADANGYFAVIPSTITVTAIPSNIAGHWIYKDKTHGHFGDFEHLLQINLVSSANGGHAVPYMVSNVIDEGADCRINSSQALFIMFERSSAGTPYRIYLFDCVDDNSDVYECAVNTEYYCTVERAGTTLTCEIYSDSDRTNLLVTLSVVCDDTALRYIFGTNSYHGGIAATMNDYTKNLDLQEVGLPMGLGLKPAPKGNIGRPPLGTGGASFGG